MARLPSVDRRLVTTPQIESSVSGDDIASPYRMVGAALGHLGNVIAARQEEAGAEEGANAVTRDAQGNLQVTQRSELTAGGHAYNRAAHQAYVARLSGDIRGAANRLQVEARGDPAAFNSAWNAFRRQTVKNALPATRGAVETLIDQEGQRTYDTVVVEKRNSDIKAFQGSIKAEIDVLDDELAALARNGGTSTPDYQEKRGQFRDLYQELADNPDFDVDQKEVDIAMKRAESRHLAEASIGAVRRVYDMPPDQGGGMAGAENAAKALFSDPKLDLSPTERRQYTSLAISDLQTAERERKSDLRIYKTDVVANIEKRLRDRIGIDDGDVDEAIDQLTNLGDPVGALKIMRARASAREIVSFEAMPDAQQLTTAESALGSGNFVDRVISAESSGNPQARAGTSQAVGLGQFIPSTWGAFLAERHPDLVGSGQDFRTDPALSREAVEWYAAKNGDALKAAGIQPTAGNLYLAHFLGPQGAIDMLSADSVRTAASVNPAAADANQTVFYKQDGTPRSAAEIVAWAARKMGDDGAGPAIPTEVLDAYRAEVTADFKQNLDSMVAGLAKGLPPSAEDLNAFSREMALITDTDLRDEAATKLQSYQAGYLLRNLPPPEQEQFLETVRSGMGADGFSESERTLLSSLNEARDQAATAIADDPVAYGHERGITPAPPPLDFSTPEATAAGMALREKNAATTRQAFRTADVSVFSKPEAQGIADSIANGAPPEAAAAMNAIANVSDDSLEATIGQAPIKDAITGAVRGNDPAKFQSALTALDQLWARAPETVEKAFGGDVINSLQDWQAKLRYYGPDQLTEELKRRDDPQVAAKREKVEAAGEELARKKSIDEIVGAFDPGYFTTGPDVPADPLTRNTLLADYETLFGQRYGATQDEAVAHDQAVQRMRGIWSRSEVNGGRLTLYAPETAYSPVDGSYNWMRQQLAADLSTFGNAPKDFSVIADRTTQAEIQNGKAASYLVMIQNSATGEFDLVRNADGKPLRYAWDQSKVQTEADAKFLEERKRIFGGGFKAGMVGRGAYPGAGR